jgi:hypothetical protein
MNGSKPQCTYSHCDAPNQLSCAANVLVICTESNEAYLEDCSHCDSSGTCSSDGTNAGCSVPFFGCN